MEMLLTNCVLMLNWIELIVYIKMDLVLNNLQRLICHKTKPNQYSDHTAFYTDGSKTVDGTGAAVTNINSHKQIRLTNIASIYSAELQAIKMALDMIKNSETTIQPSSNLRGKPKPPIHTRDTRNISLSNKLWENSGLCMGS